MEENPERALRVLAVWFEVSPGDTRSAWDAGLLTDSRVQHLWDGERAVGLWLPRQEGYRELIRGSFAWDVYLLYGPEARWDGRPWPLLSLGSPIISKADRLRDSLVPLL